MLLDITRNIEMHGKYENTMNCIDRFAHSEVSTVSEWRLTGEYGACGEVREVQGRLPVRVADVGVGAVL